MATLVESIPCGNVHHDKRRGQPGWTPIICTSEQERSLVTRAWMAWMGELHVCGACWIAFAVHHNQRLSAGQRHEHSPLSEDHYTGPTLTIPAGYGDPWPARHLNPWKG